MTLSRRELVRTSAVVAGSALAAPLLTGCGSDPSASVGPKQAEDADLEEFYEKAKKEGGVTWWASNVDTTQGAALIKAFEQKYPGIEVEALFQNASQVLQRVTTDFDAKRYELDVFGTSDETQCQLLKPKNALAEFRPPMDDAIPDQFRELDTDNTYQASALGLIVLTTNSNEVTQPPTAWRDLLDDSWDGQISLAHPAYSGAMLVGVLGVVDLHGWEYWEQIGELGPKINQSTLDTVRDLLNGERTVGTSIESASFQSNAQGRPIDVVIPEDGPILQVNPQAVMRNAPHPYAARLLQSFFFSEEAAKVMRDVWKIPMRTDVRPKSEIDITKVNAVNVSPETVADSREEATRKWREYMGV